MRSSTVRKRLGLLIVVALALWVAWVDQPVSKASRADQRPLQPGTITIDTQEWRDQPTRHLYVHGTLNGDTAFVLYLPEPAGWKGRLLQFLAGGLGGTEKAGSLVGHPHYALAHGAVYVESSQGHIGQGFYEEDDTPKETAYEANYAVVQYAKIRCVELYGKEPDFTYVFGNSGGGFRSSILMELFPKVYDGAVPTAGGGQPKTVWYVLSLLEAYQPVLEPKSEAIRDKVRPGSTGDLWDVLQTPEERRAARTLLRAGYPRSELGLPGFRMPLGAISMDFFKRKVDPSYFDDFWKVPGYGGADGEFNTQVDEGIQGVIKAVEGGGYRLTTDLGRPDGSLHGYTLTFASGAAKGDWRIIQTNSGPALQLSSAGPPAKGVQPGDQFTLSNRDLLAFQASHRYIVECDDPALADYCRDGKPIYVQRPREKVDGLYENYRPLGHIQGKVIALFGGADHGVWPTIAARYHRQVKQALGDKIHDHFRIYFFEHGTHGMTLGNPENLSALVGGGQLGTLVWGSWAAAQYKALDDLMLWVEQGIAPQPSTEYAFDDMNQLVLPKTAQERKGYQPVVTITANGQSDRLEISTGTEVTFKVTAEDPDNEVILTEIDFDGDHTFDQSNTSRSKQVTATWTYRYEKPGTYFATVRVTDSTASEGAPERLMGIRIKGVQNIAQIRVIVK